MDNVIVIPRGIESYKLCFGMGVLVGMGIDYRVNSGSQVAMALNERRRERTLELENGLVLESDTNGVKILSSGNPNDCKVNVRVAHHA